MGTGDAESAVGLERGVPTRAHEVFRRLGGRVVMVRDDEHQTVAAYTSEWAQQLGWERDEFVNWPALDIGFLPDYDGSSAENVATSRDRLDQFADAHLSWSRVIVDRSRTEQMHTAHANRWVDDEDLTYWVIALIDEHRSAEEVLARARSVSDAVSSLVPFPESGEDTTDTRRRLSVRIDRGAGREIEALARREGVTLNGLLQALIEGINRADRIDMSMIDDSEMGFGLALAKTSVERAVARARAIDYERRTPTAGPDAT